MTQRAAPGVASGPAAFTIELWKPAVDLGPAVDVSADKPAAGGKHA